MRGFIIREPKIISVVQDQISGGPAIVPHGATLVNSVESRYLGTPTKRELEAQRLVEMAFPLTTASKAKPKRKRKSRAKVKASK